MYLQVVVEGIVDVAVAHEILSYVGFDKAEYVVLNQGGKAKLLRKLPEYNRTAAVLDWLVIVDLDNDAGCAPEYLSIILPNARSKMILRIAVREVEAWLMADRERMATFLSAGLNRVPLEPDADPEPKQTIINLASRYANQERRQGMVPRHDSGAKVGEGYATHIIEFVHEKWRLEAARGHSDSLDRCLKALEYLRGTDG